MSDAHYSVHELAELAGVTVRALHHYEAKGLLVPERHANGYRAYTSTDTERLQHILLLKSCGMSLAEIERVLDAPNCDVAAELERHVSELQAERDRLERIIGTAEKTIRNLRGELAMSDSERFEGLKRETLAENEARYGAEVRERFGNEVVDAANARLQAMTEKEWNDVNALEQAIIDQLIVAMAERDVRSEASRALTNMHARWISVHWPEGTYNAEAHRNLAQAYLADERFIAYYDSHAGEGATKFLVEALTANL